MISIIICSTSHAISDELEHNISTTIGDSVEYEIVCIDNSDNHYSIFSAYTEGVLRATGDSLCFVHEDVIFHSTDWGGKCERQLKENPQIGMLGVFGCLYFSRMSSVLHPWNMLRGQLLQGHSENGEYKTDLCRYVEYDEYENEVVVVDGLWLFIRRSLFDESLIAWDAEAYSGFHFYDKDISMQILKSGYMIAIADIPVEHKSLGNFNKAYWENSIVFHSKWADFLPVKNRNIPDWLIAQSDYNLSKDIANDKITILEYEELLDRMHFHQVYGVYTWIKRFINKILSIK